MQVAAVCTQQVVLIYIYIYMCVSLVVPMCPVSVCACDIKSEYKQKQCQLRQTFSKFDSLLYKTHSKVLMVLRYQGSTSLGP